jgi:tRNA threonylcarbamoyladenosine biosynthesis protein TsaE
MDTWQWSSMGQTRNWVTSFCQELKPPCLVLLSGTLGAGKTQMVKWFMQELKVDGAVSPTFAIHQQYESSVGTVDHIDLYRLQSDLDLESSGVMDLLSRGQGLIFVEWADRLPENFWPEKFKKIWIHLEIGPGETRRARIRTVRPRSPNPPRGLG